MDACSSLGIALAQKLVSRVGPELLISVLPTLAGARVRRRRKAELGQSGSQVEACPADDDRSQTLGERAIDHVMRQLCVFPDRGLVFERPDRHELCRPFGLVRENRDAAVNLHRIGRDQPRGDPVGQRFGDGGLTGRSGPEDRDDAPGQRSLSRGGAPGRARRCPPARGRRGGTPRRCRTAARAPAGRPPSPPPASR